MNYKDNFKKAFSGMDIKGMEEAGNNIIEKLNPLLNQMQSEHLKLARPKDKKKCKVNGVESSVSLIEDGRVIITFSTLKESEDFFKNIERFDNKKWYQKLF